MRLCRGEPGVQVWRIEPVAAVLAPADRPAGRPLIVAVDGRSAGGKRTTAERRAATVPGAAAVHTDDVGRREVPFLAADRSWERTDHIVSGGSELPYDPASELVVADRMMES
jgi:hypothetical protein